MMRAFLFSFVAGLALSVGLSAVFPLPDHERFPSSIEVLNNGGRQEQFLIRWPQDRLAVPGRPNLLTSVADSTAFLLGSGGSTTITELFRLRDVAENVIGIAVRTTGNRSGAASNSDWMLLMPSRGSMLMTQRDSANLAPLRTADGWILPAETRAFWTAGKRYRITAGPAPGGHGKILRGTEEFARLTGSYTETWELVNQLTDGTTEGRILLSTTMRSK